MEIKSIIENYNNYLNKEISVNGWINNARIQTNIAFIALNDGSCQSTLQIVIEFNEETSCSEKLQDLKSLSKGASISITGKIIESPGKGQPFEMKSELSQMIINGKVISNEYPLSKGKHSLEYIRQFPHLRVRTNTFGMIARVRNTCTFATHKFFQSKGYMNVHTPIITSNDCEGAGETFTVTTLNNDKSNINNVKTTYENDFFNKKTFLTVSGQLQGESYAMGLSKIYTFGPTFRAENSNTSRHLAEFWMIEPEAAFVSFEELMELAEDYIKFCVNEVITNNYDDIIFIDKFIRKGQLKFLEDLIKTPFKKLTYSDAIDILQKDYNENVKYEKIDKWGIDLNSEQEKYLTSKFGPVIVYNYPKDIKSFYMKLNQDNSTVQAMDILVPNIGELIGGSMREENYDKLKKVMIAKDMNIDHLSWYLDLRKYGSAPHGGFGLGFERLIMLISGISNIKDCIPFPRYPSHCIN